MGKMKKSTKKTRSAYYRLSALFAAGSINLVGKEHTPSGGSGGHRRKQADTSPETENTAFQDDDKEYGFASNLFVDGNNSTDKLSVDAESSSSSFDWP